MKTTLKVIALALAISTLTACASVGVRTVGKQPITIIVGYVPEIVGKATPNPTPEVKK